VSDAGADAADDGGADAGASDAAASDAAASDGGADADNDAGAGLPATPVSYTFNTTVENWYFTPYGSTPTNDPNSAANYAKTSMIAWDASGALKGTVPFQFEGDQIDFQAFSAQPGKYNWVGFTISAKVKLVSGGNIKNGCPMSAVLYLSTVGWDTKLSAPVNLVAGQYVTVNFDVDDAMLAGINVSTITQMGIQVTTGPACVGTPTPDGGSDASDGSTSDGAGSSDGSTSDGAGSSDGSTSDGAGSSDAASDAGASSDAAADVASNG
jgi:hypothetical protein